MASIKLSKTPWYRPSGTNKPVDKTSEISPKAADFNLIDIPPFGQGCKKIGTMAPAVPRKVLAQ